MSVAKAVDDLDALRAVIEAVKELEQDDQRRIFRWAAEKLGLPQPFGGDTRIAGHPWIASSSAHSPTGAASGPQPGDKAQQDIKSFVAAKNPKSDMQFAATVAYFYRFLAPEAEKKATINKDDLLDACRKVDRQRPAKAYLTLNNAYQAGLLDRVEKSTFSINSVGENLVAMTLPDGGAVDGPARKRSTKVPARENHRAKVAKGTTAKRNA